MLLTISNSKERKKERKTERKKERKKERKNRNLDHLASELTAGIQEAQTQRVGTACTVLKPKSNTFPSPGNTYVFTRKGLISKTFHELLVGLMVSFRPKGCKMSNRQQ